MSCNSSDDRIDFLTKVILRYFYIAAKLSNMHVLHYHVAINAINL